MATERMYELAFQYKGTKLWQQLYDDELFAVRSIIRHSQAFTSAISLPSLAHCFSVRPFFRSIFSCDDFNNTVLFYIEDIRIIFCVIIRNFVCL